MPEPTIMRCVGLSRDQRTNRWSVTCPACGNQFEPQTTLLSTQVIDCPAKKCGKRLLADYNAEPPTLKVLEQEP